MVAIMTPYTERCASSHESQGQIAKKEKSPF